MAATGVIALTAAPYLRAGDGESMTRLLTDAGFGERAPGPPPATLEVDLTPGPDAILAGFRKTTRNLIRRARREGTLVVAEAGADRDAEALQALYDAMGAKGATPRPAPFFRDLVRFLAEEPARGFALLARHAGRVLAGAVVLRHGTRAIYAFGASAREEPALPKGHVVQYEAMCRAHRDGARVYDLGGFAEGTGEPDRRTAAQQVNFWKSGLGGRPVPLLAPRRLVLRPWLQRLESTGRRLIAGRRRDQEAGSRGSSER